MVSSLLVAKYCRRASKLSNQHHQNTSEIFSSIWPKSPSFHSSARPSLPNSSCSQFPSLKHYTLTYFFFFHVMCKVCKGLDHAFLWCVSMWCNRPVEKYPLKQKQLATEQTWRVAEVKCSIASHISSTFSWYKVLAIQQKGTGCSV